MVGRYDLASSPHRRRLDGFMHNAVHDIESFFWVLLYICLTRKGPGGARRDELNYVEHPDEHTSNVRRVIYSYFDGGQDTISRNKLEVMSNESVFEAKILPYIHRYFIPLVGLLKKWRGLLDSAHSYHLSEHDFIHNRTLKLLEEASYEIVETREEHELTKKERERRKAEITRILETCRRISNPSDTNTNAEVSPSTPPPSQRYHSLPFDRTPQAYKQENEGQQGQRSQSPESPLAKKSKMDTGPLRRVDQHCG